MSTIKRHNTAPWTHTPCVKIAGFPDSNISSSSVSLVVRPAIYHRAQVPWLVLRFWWNIELTKFSQNFAESFGKTISNISPPSWAISLHPNKTSWEITYSMLYDIFLLSTFSNYNFCQNFEYYGKLSERLNL